jgi:predicted metalloprotease with PDZ domain
MKKKAAILTIVIAVFLASTITAQTPFIQYSLSFEQAANHKYKVQLQTGNWAADSIIFKMPRWMPGYYQFMDYAKSVEDISFTYSNGRPAAFMHPNENTWIVKGIRQKKLSIQYNINTNRQFVANSYADSAHAYIIPANSFLYADGFINLPVTVKISTPVSWPDIATGLQPLTGNTQSFSAGNFDILYDCPILTGKLDILPPFMVNKVPHRFMAYNAGNFNRQMLMDNLQKVVQAAVNIIGDIPYSQYTFIGIGPGRGGIEHLNNTTVSFNGNNLNNAGTVNTLLNFLAHEYFHHYNVKRIRPFELGPFDYEKGSRTSLLWISEGLSVYYEYLIVKRAGLSDAKTLLENFEKNITAFENSAGKSSQSLAQASYNTWADGPFGTQGKTKAISYYDKGPVVGLLFDFSIRHFTNNTKSLDDIMRKLYWQYYKKLNRGFTDAEFQQVCEEITGKRLEDMFEYINTARQLDYATILAYAGLELLKQEDSNGKAQFILKRKNNTTALEDSIYKSWLGE